MADYLAAAVNEDSRNGTFLEEKAMAPSSRTGDIFPILEMIQSDTTVVKGKIDSVGEDVGSIQVEMAELRGKIASMETRMTEWATQVREASDQKLRLVLLEERIKNFYDAVRIAEKNQGRIKNIHWQIWIALLSSVLAPIILHFVIKEIPSLFTK